MLSHFRSSMLLICFSILFYFLTVSPKQFYDPTPCSSPQLFPGSLYTCNSSLITCDTYIVYRSQPRFQTILEISGLFGVDANEVLFLNNLTDESEILERDRDVLVPIQCSCYDGSFRSNTSYSFPATATLATVSCDTYEGLVKLPTLVQENIVGARDPGKSLVVPLRCACVDKNDVVDGFNMLLTYPIVEYDTIVLVANRFGIPPSDVWLQNSLDPYPTIYPNTTIIVPLRSHPHINSSIRDPQPRAPGFIPLSPTQITKSKSKLHKHLYAIGSGIGLLLILFVLLGMGFFCRAKYKQNDDKLRTLSFRSSTISCLSPDILAVMSKYSVISYSTKELSDATQGFSEVSKLGATVYKGCLGDTELVIKQMSFGDARRTIGIHSKINHSNIVKLEGVCYGEDELSPSYLVFEFAQKKSLRDCLANESMELPWHRRVRIAFDVSIGLHYIHHCTVPSYIHMNINSRNILVTDDWRAKIANLGVGSVISSSKERSDVMMTAEGWIAPEYLYQGLVSAKVDVFAFGVVLLELLSAKQAKDRSFVTKSLGFLSETGCANGCFNELRDFIDPNLTNYPIADTLCLTILSKACVEDDPLHRPSMDDILKVLARMER